MTGLGVQVVSVFNPLFLAENFNPFRKITYLTIAVRLQTVKTEHRLLSE